MPVTNLYMLRGHGPVFDANIMGGGGHSGFNETVC